MPLGRDAQPILRGGLADAGALGFRDPMHRDEIQKPLEPLNSISSGICLMILREEGHLTGLPFN
jgi:hypothetical protein